MRNSSQNKDQQSDTDTNEHNANAQRTEQSENDQNKVETSRHKESLPLSETKYERQAAVGWTGGKAV